MRVLPNWLEAYAEYTEPQESPSWFHLFCGMSVLASTLGRRVLLDRGAYTLFPNLYVLLMANSSKCRKSGAIDIAAGFLETIGLKILADKITPQAIVKLGHATPNADFSVVIVSDELRVLLPGKSPVSEDAIVLLTKLWNCPKHFSATTVSRGTEELHNVCINWLAGTTPTWLNESASVSALGGGLIGRILVCESSDDTKCNPLPVLNSDLRLALINDLLHIKQLSGTACLAEGAEVQYGEWYRSIRAMEHPEMLDGTVGRLHDQALKLALLTSVSESDSLIVEPSHLRVGIELAEEVCRQVKSGAFATGISQKERRVANQIMRKGTVSHADLLRANSYDMSAKDLRDVIDTLVSSDLIEAVYAGKKLLYSWKG